MTVNSSLLSCGFIRRKSTALVVAALFALSLCIGLMAPQPARAAGAVTTLDKMQVAVSLEGTSTTAMAVTVGVPASVALPCTVPVTIPMGYALVQQGEFDTDPSSPTATTHAVASAPNSATITYTFTLTKSHNFFFAATSAASIYNNSAMGTGGATLAAFDVTAATDITSLLVGIEPPASGMTGAGGSTMQTYNAGKDSAGNDIKLYGQTFANVKKGDKKTVQIAFMQQVKAQQDAAAQKQSSTSTAVNGFFSQPLVWMLGAVLVIVIVILVFVIMRQRQNVADDDEFEDEDEPEDEAQRDDDRATDEKGVAQDSDDEVDPFADASDTED